jgi:uncharacterized membrane protein
VVVLSLIEARGVFLSPTELGAEEVITNIVLWLKLAIEIVGALLIGIGATITSVRIAGVIWHQRLEDYRRVRLAFARLLALALEFQLAADIVGTAFAPSWTQIGKLAAIAVIRTALNYFLAREINEGRELSKALNTADNSGTSPSALAAELN